jgi:hypothetical protein
MGRDVARRLRILEATLEDSACPECGSLPGLAATTYEVVWTHDGEEVEELGELEFCEMCGMQTTYTVTWESFDD